MDKPLLSLTAADLMSRELILVPAEMSLQGAARLLSRSHVTGAPVVDSSGRCIGVLSSTDILHWVENPKPKNEPKAAECVCRSWQIFGNEAAPSDCVRAHMTGNPVTVTGNAAVGELALMMIDAHIHRVIVVDAMGCPIGIVSSTDILAAVARHARTNVSETPKGRECQTTGR